MRRVSVPVRTPAGLEAATWLPTTDPVVVIWRSADRGRHWIQIGGTTYPTNRYLSRCSPVITAATPAGSPNAAFVLHECLTGDGSANASAVADGPEGCGVLQQTGARRLTSTGAGAHGFVPRSAVRWDIEFDRGELVTIDGGDWFGVAGSGLFPRVERWKWRHGGFSPTADSAFIAQPSPRPDLNWPTLPTGRCPANGTYQASFGVRYTNRRHEPNSPLLLMVFPPSYGYPTSPTCTQFVLSSLPLTIEAVHTTAPLVSLRRGHLSNRRWITAPAWC
jgi:hypothetical protein